MKKYYYDEQESSVMIGTTDQEENFTSAFVIKEDHKIQGFKLESNYIMFSEIQHHEDVFHWLEKKSNVEGITIKKFCKALERQLDYKKLV